MTKMAEDQPGIKEVSKALEEVKSDIEGVVSRKK
jgi:hypothetical protein